MRGSPSFRATPRMAATWPGRGLQGTLTRVERVLRAIKTDRLQVRPTHVCAENWVRAHVFRCMLAWYLEWHLRQTLAPLLCEDDDPEGARAKRRTPVEESRLSDSARRKTAFRPRPTASPSRTWPIC